MRRMLFCLLPVVSSLGLFAQQTGVIRSEPVKEDQKVFVTVGPEVNLTIPTSFGSDQTSLASDTLFTVNSAFRFRFGINLRIDFSSRFSLQTGLYYHSRRHQVQIGRTSGTNQQIDSLIFENGVNYIGYEIPIMALVYVRLGERSFLNNAVGLSLDFFPSSSQRLDPEKEFKIYNGRNSWFIPSARASVGFEYRTRNSGYLYFGGSFHQPFFDLTDIFIERNQPPGPIGFQTQVIPISGTYFSIDLKYFFPPGKDNKFLKSTGGR
jgi:hypothetical protein